MKGREWIDTGEAGQSFLIKFDRDGDFHGYQYATCSGVIDALSDQAYASFIDEEPDTLTVWRLTASGPVPVVVECARHDSINMVAVTLLWRERVRKGKFARMSETGFYPIMGA